MTISLSFDEAVATIREVIDEYGDDYRYQLPMVHGIARCVYFDAKKAPSCIVGHLMSRKGVTADELTFYQNRKNISIIIDNYSVMSTDNKTRCFLNQLQRYQDDGMTWGQAFERAYQETEENEWE